MYIPGNHDAALRAHAGLSVGGVEIRLQHVDVTRDGKRLLVMHGDELDVPCPRALNWAVRVFYVGILRAHVAGNALRARSGLPWWSLAGFFKHRLRAPARYIRSFERTAARAARRLKLDGIICGHIHHPRLARINGVRYCNDGDWVESCSSLVEREDGRLEIVRWPSRRTAPARGLAAAAEAA